MHRIGCVGPFIFASLICMCSVFSLSMVAECSDDNTADLVSSIIRRELGAARSQGRWMYISKYEKNGVHIEARKIQTDDGLLTWILARDSVPLSSNEIEEQRKHLNELISDSSFLDSNRKAMREDSRRINALMAELPGDVHFDCLTKTGSMATAHFEPNPDFRPLDVERRIIAGMSGTIQFDLKEMRLVSITGSEQNDISILFGLGRIYKGSSISVSRMPVAPGIWEAASVSTHIKGEAFFFKTIAQEGEEFRSGYVPVPAGLSARASLVYLER